MKLCVELESSSVRKSRPLMVSFSCIVWLVVIPVTACREISMCEWSIVDGSVLLLCVLTRENLFASAIAVAKSVGCCNSVSMRSVESNPAVYNITCWDGEVLVLLLGLM